MTMTTDEFATQIVQMFQKRGVSPEEVIAIAMRVVGVTIALCQSTPEMRQRLRHALEEEMAVGEQAAAAIQGFAPPPPSSPPEGSSN